jgi:hypothetical protein
MNTVVKYDTPKLPVAGYATEMASRIIIDDQDTYEIGSIAAKAAKARRDEIEAMRKTIVDPINAAKDAVQKIFTPVIADYDNSISLIKSKMVTYVNEQAEIQRKTQAEADRLAREAAIAAEKAAAKLEKKGNIEMAAAVREVAAMAPAAVVAPMVTQVGGNSVRKVWKAKISNWVELVQFIAANPDYLNLISFNQGVADKLMAATDGKLKIGGLEAYQDSIVAIRK